MNGITIVICEGCDIDYCYTYPDYFEAEYPEIHFISALDCQDPDYYEM